MSLSQWRITRGKQWLHLWEGAITFLNSNQTTEVHTLNRSTWEGEAGQSLGVPRLQSDSISNSNCLLLIKALWKTGRSVPWVSPHFLSGHMDGKEANMGKLQIDRNLKEGWSKDSSFHPCDPEEQRLGTSNGKEAGVNIQCIWSTVYWAIPAYRHMLPRAPADLWETDQTLRGFNSNTISLWWGERLNSRTLTPKWPCFCSSTKGEKSVLVQAAQAVKPCTGWLRHIVAYSSQR